MSRLRASTLCSTSLGQRRRIGQVAHPDAAAADLVLVGRADAARRRADLPLAAARLAEHVELAVIRQDEVGPVADEQPALDVDAEPLQLVHLGEQRRRIDHHAVADDADDAGMQDARRDQVEDELLAAHVDRVAGVVAALVPADHRELRRQQIDDLALALVAPLGAQHGDVHGRSSASRRRMPTGRRPSVRRTRRGYQPLRRPCASRRS